MKTTQEILQRAKLAEQDAPALSTVQKNTALLKMAELLGIAPEKTIAVGDFNNDVSMIRAAGIGFAVDNAVAEAKAVADYVTVSNNHHAIAAIVDRLDRGLFAAK